MNNIDEFGVFTVDMWMGPNTGANKDFERNLTIMTLGLAGETGEVMELLKKRLRDNTFDKDNLVKELGDVIYYWARICKMFDLQPSDVLQANMEKLIDRRQRGVQRGSGDNR